MDQQSSQPGDIPPQLQSPPPSAAQPPAAAPPAISPTGAPVVSSKLTPWFLTLAAICGVLAGASKIPGLNLPEAVFGYATLGAALFAALAGATPGLRSTGAMLLLCLVIGLFSCAHVDPLIATGTAIDSAAHLAASVSTAMDLAVQEHRISPDTYAKWGSFLAVFKPTWDLLQAEWGDAKATQNAAEAQKIEGALATLVAKLGEFEALLLLEQPAAVDGGAP